MKRSLFLFLCLCFSFSFSTNENADSNRGLPSSWTIIPSRSLAGLHYLFKGYELSDDESLVKVTGPVIQIINGETIGAKVFKNGYFSEIELEDFEDQQELGLSVFEAKTGAGTNVATAFLVGKNIVITNRHVIAPRPGSKNLACGKFSIKLNHKDETVPCEKIRYCSNRFDYCVVQMKNMENGDPLSSEVKPLRLSKNSKTNMDIRLLHIGNAAGLGIQASTGTGMVMNKGEFFHYVPTLGGSSGAPIFNERGYVVGVNWGHTGGNFIDDAAFNRGVLITTIYQELRLSMPELVKEIKSFRSWYNRIFRHRKVKIADNSKVPSSSVSK